MASDVREQYEQRRLKYFMEELWLSRNCVSCIHISIRMCDHLVYADKGQLPARESTDWVPHAGVRSIDLQGSMVDNEYRNNYAHHSPYLYISYWKAPRVDGDACTATWYATKKKVMVIEVYWLAIGVKRMKGREAPVIT